MSDHTPARIDVSRCCGCTQCRLVCPVDAIMLESACCQVDEARCMGCGQCRWVCPLRCINAAGIDESSGAD